MPNRVYTVEFENVTITNAGGDQDLFQLDAGAEKPIEIIGMTISPALVPDLGDAQEETLRYRIIRGHTTVGSGGAAPTPRPVKATDAAAGFTARTNDTTIASAGTAVNLHSDGWNIRVGHQLWLPDACEPDTSGAVFLVVRLMAAPADDLICSGTLYVVEKG